MEKQNSTSAGETAEANKRMAETAADDTVSRAAGVSAAADAPGRPADAETKAQGTAENDGKFSADKKAAEKMAKPKRRRRLGDRSDGRKLRSLDPLNRVGVFIMKTRNDACNLFEDSIDITRLDEYIHKKRREGLKGFGIMDVFIAAYVRTVATMPGINRFISGQTIFARNDIQISLAIKKEMKLDAQETVVKFFFTPQSTIEEIHDQIVRVIEQNKEKGDQSSFDSTARILNYIPRLLLRFTVGFLNLLDYFGLIPKFLLDLSPFHASLFITSMGSLGIPPIYHHLYNFGNIPIFLSFGAKRTDLVLRKDGTVEQRKFVDYKVVLDERICDGHYYASALKRMREVLKNPYVLDEPPAEVVEDIE